MNFKSESASPSDIITAEELGDIYRSARQTANGRVEEKKKGRWVTVQVTHRQVSHHLN